MYSGIREIDSRPKLPTGMPWHRTSKLSFLFRTWVFWHLCAPGAYHCVFVRFYMTFRSRLCLHDRDRRPVRALECRPTISAKISNTINGRSRAVNTMMSNDLAAQGIARMIVSKSPFERSNQSSTANNEATRHVCTLFGFPRLSK